MGTIDINARYLNLDGTIQSGIDKVDLTISENFAPAASSQFLDNKGALLSGLTVSSAHRTAVNGYVDTNKKLITLDDIKPEGGVVNLTGTIINTGSGAIKVASGYASVNIQNKSSYALATGVIDASTNRAGTVTITDTATLKREVYTFKDGRYTQESFLGTLKTTGGLSSVVYDATGKKSDAQANLGTPLIYQPEPGRFYVWTEGVAKTKTKYEVFEDKSFNLIGVNWDWMVPDKAAVSTVEREVDGEPLLESELVVEASEITKLFGNELPTGVTFFAEYKEKRNLAVELIQNKSLVR
ncbi:MAG: hypothetical protein ACKOQO_00845, partial [Candidatus Limnocylindrus sp.]